MKITGKQLTEEIKKELDVTPTETLAEVAEALRLYNVRSYDCIQDTYEVELK